MKRPLMAAVLSFTLGEVACRCLTKHWLISIVCIAFEILYVLYSNKAVKTRFAVLLLFLFFLLGAAWNLGALSDRDKGLEKLLDSQNQNGATPAQNVGSHQSSQANVTLRGEVLNIKHSAGGITFAVDVGKEKVSCYLKTEGVQKTEDEIEGGYGENGEVESEKSEIIKPGARLLLTGSLSRPEGQRNPGAFDENQYDEGLGIHVKMLVDEVKLESEYDGIEGWVRSKLYDVKMYFAGAIDRNCSDAKHASILKAMVLGVKDEMDEETKMLYQKAGMAHIIAISGLHIAILAGALKWLLALCGLRKRWIALATILFLLAYGFMTGFAPATTRAVIMLCMKELAVIVGRTADMPTSMAEALLLMILFNPDAIFSAGMQMSFGAVAGVYTSMKLYRSMFGKERFLMLPLRLRAVAKTILMTVLTSLSVNLFLLPITIFYYYEFPLYGMLLNFLVIPLASLVVGAGFLVAAIGAFSVVPAFAMLVKVPCFVAEKVLNLYEVLCRTTLSMPASRINPGHAEIWMTGLHLLLVLGLVLFFVRPWGERRRKGRDKARNIMWNNSGDTARNKVRNIRSSVRAGALKELLYLLMCIVLSAAGTLLVTVYNQSLNRVAFLDVGQGDSSILHVDKHNFIVDSGSSTQKNVGKYTLLPALKYYGMSEIDAVFVSHTDKDHVSGLIELMEGQELYGVKVHHLIFAKGTEMDENKTRLIEAARQYGTKIVELSQGDEISISKEKKRDAINAPSDMTNDERVDAISFNVLSPERNQRGTGNEYSLVLDVNIKNRLEILYTGDIGAETEEELIQQKRRDVGASEYKNGNGENHICILKVAHHGSKYSTSSEFLQWAGADIAVISVGKRNRYDHPSKETLERLAEGKIHIRRTDREGAIVVKIY